MTLTDSIQRLRDAGVDVPEALREYKRWESNPYRDPIMDNERADAAIHALVEALLAANSWDSMMRVLDRHYPAEVVDGSSGDPGPTIVVLTRAIDDLKKRLLTAQKELRVMQSSLGGHNYVDATPDNGYPRRILESYIDEDYWSDSTAGEDSTNPLVVAMNEWREARNVILRAALDALAARPVACGECADHKHQCCENTESGLWMARVADDFWCKRGRRA